MSQLVAERARDAGKPRRPAPELAAFRESEPRPLPKSSPKSKSKSPSQARPKKRAHVKKFQKKNRMAFSFSSRRPKFDLSSAQRFHRGRRRARTSHAGPSADSNSPSVQTAEEGRIRSIAARTTAIRPRPFRSFARHSGCRARRLRGRKCFPRSQMQLAARPLRVDVDLRLCVPRVAVG